MSDNLYNINMERAVLSAVIFDPEIFEGVMVKLKPKDFYATISPTPIQCDGGAI